MPIRPLNKWTDLDLVVLGELDARGMDPAQIAGRMGRSPEDIGDHLVIIRQRKGRLSNPVFETSPDG